MCGIVGYIGDRKIVPILIKGLERLEYRGYDSSGIACLEGEGEPILFSKERGKLAALKSQLNGFSPRGSAGIGHTRWATHGVPSRANAHPHLDAKKEFAVVHNGIIENYSELRAELTRKGYKFLSETDTEVLVHLIRDNYQGDFTQAFIRAVQKLRGFFAFAAISSFHPDMLLAFRRSNPLVIGVGKNENFVASDVAPLLSYTRRVIYPQDDQVVVLNKTRVQVLDLHSGRSVSKRPVLIKWDVAQAEKGGYPHFMLKEIFEQPQVAAETLAKRVRKASRIVFDTLDKRAESKLTRAKKIFAVSCGTAYHASMVSKYLIEDFVRVPVECWVSSEFRYADPILTAGDVVIFITQSGETADTLAALREAKEKGAFTIAICNVVGSTISREADAVIYTHAGPEIGVASTKAYVAQLLTVTLFSLYLARLMGTLSGAEMKKYLKLMQALPQEMETILKTAPHIKKVAKALASSRNFLYMARGYNSPTALEGTLKLQEISYVHAHGYAAGEMKHGPIALVEKRLPVVCICPQSSTYEKMVSNVEEIKARAGIVVGVVTERDVLVKKHADYTLEIPRVPEFLSPLLTIIPLQLLAYYVSMFNGCDVDQPRNLAKSVTVE